MCSSKDHGLAESGANPTELTGEDTALLIVAFYSETWKVSSEGELRVRINALFLALIDAGKDRMDWVIVIVL